jgi:hypothetical protein
VKNTTSKGDITTAKVLAALVAAGKNVLVPWSDGLRYDLVVEEGGRFLRVQSKTGQLVQGAIRFRTCSVDGPTRRSRGYRGEIDLFGIYCPKLDKAYLVPIEALRAQVIGSLRIKPTLNGQAKKVVWAREFELQSDVAQAEVV